MKRKATRSSNHGKHRMVECEKCGKRMNSDKLLRHLKTHNPTKTCEYCKNAIREDLLQRHEILCKDNVDETMCNRGHVTELDTNLECSSVFGRFKNYTLDVEKSTDYDIIIKNTLTAAKHMLANLVADQPVKSQIVLKIEFVRNKGEIEEQSAEMVFRSVCEPLLVGDSLDAYLNRAGHYIRVQLTNFEKNGSGWLFHKLNSSNIEIASYRPLAGSGTVEIPQKIKNMKSVLNIKSPDNKCILYCLLAGLGKSNGNKDPGLYGTYKDRANEIDMGDITFPVKIRDISKIEELNKISISVFEWSVDDDCVVPLKHGSGIGSHVDLLYIQDNYTGHYMLIKNFNAFMRHRTKHHNSMFYCRTCLHGFKRESLLSSHKDHCSRVCTKCNPDTIKQCPHTVNQVTKMPEEGVIEFKSTHKQDKKLFALYFDFECVLKPVEETASNTTKYQKHVPCSFCIVTTSEFKEYEKETIVFSHEDPDTVIKTFLKELDRIHDDMMECYEANQHPISMTEADEKAFKSAETCHICNKKLQWGSDTNYPVRDHDHTKQHNNFRGAACNSCNRNFYNRSRKVPAFAHNLKKYDSNLFLLSLIKNTEDVKVIPENLEAFKAIFTDKFTFLDSFAFLSTSLDKLSASLKPESFIRLKEAYPEHSDLLSRKGVYFYDYATSFDVFKETCLPPKDAFYNKLNEESISDKDYERACEVFQKLGCKNLRDYMELYVKTDTLILCCVFENFRQLCLDYYQLDCCHYVSIPGFAWDAMLKHSGVKLELLTDKEMYDFAYNNLRGGLCTINHRYFKANNKYLENYKHDLPSFFIHYIDACNLYGKSMMMKLPTGNFRWVTEDLDIMALDPEGDTCYILEVDLDYPDHLHDYHNDYPLAVESKIIQENWLSAFNQQFLEKHDQKFLPSRKLCPDLTSKKKYVCALRNLQFYIKQGLVLKKIHRVLAADQSSFVKSYIEFNSQKRRQVKTKFEQDFFKLVNNSIYGKFIEDLMKRTNVDIVTNEKRAEKLINRPQFKGFHILDEDVTVVQSVKKTVTLNKPVACGFMVLENSKHIMAEMWYSVLKPRYGGNIKLILSDTDSFIYGVETEDGYQDLYDLKDHMDLSEYSETSDLCKFRDVSNKKVPGKFSDERPNGIIKEVIALKPKMYSLDTRLLECKKDHICNNSCLIGHTATAKGISRVAKRSITHQDYKTVLETRGTTTVTVKSMRSYQHQMYTISTTKRGLSSYDDKKYILDDGITCLSYGHYKLRK